MLVILSQQFEICSNLRTFEKVVTFERVIDFELTFVRK